MELEGEPGSAKFGNFINYYRFNPAETRVKLIPPDLLSTLFPHDVHRPLCALDVGCNSGNLTVSLWQHLTHTTTQLTHNEQVTCAGDASGPVVQRFTCSTSQPMLGILAVDLDKTLIERSQQSNPHKECITYQVKDVSKEADRTLILQECQKLFGCTKYDLICCFSTTMWIHLNNGDEGLREVLEFFSKSCKYLIVEPQPWKCYRNAMRRMKKLDCDLFPNFKTLQWRTDVDKEIRNYLETDCHMSLVTELGSTDWGRIITIYKSPH